MRFSSKSREEKPFNCADKLNKTGTFENVIMHDFIALIIKFFWARSEPVVIPLIRARGAHPREAKHRSSRSRSGINFFPERVNYTPDSI
jgi:hypothetical protein